MICQKDVDFEPRLQLQSHCTNSEMHLFLVSVLAHKLPEGENVIRPMDLDLLASKQVDRNKTYFQFLTELFFRRVGYRPKIKPEKFLFGIRPNCNIVTSELDLHHFYSRSNSQHQKLWQVQLQSPFLHEKFYKQVVLDSTRYLKRSDVALLLLLVYWNWAYQVLEGLE